MYRLFRTLIPTCILIATTGATCGDGDIGAPILTNLSLSTAEDTPLTIAVPLTAAQPSEVTFTVEAAPGHGTLIGTGPQFTYTPAADYVGDDSITVRATDLYGTATATVAITVSSVNDAPVAGADSFATGFDAPLTVAQAALLMNDSDIETTGLVVTSVTAASHGTPVLTGNDVVFTPEAGFTGTATFTYAVSDGGATATGMVTVTIGPDSAPEATDDAITTAEDVTATISDTALLGNDTDVENHTLAITAVGNASHGTVSHDGAQVTFVPEANYHGPAGFEYTVSDGFKTDVGAVVMTIGAVNDNPSPVADTASSSEDAELTINAATLVANDSDIDGDTVTVTAVTGTAGSHGSVTLATGIITYTPDQDFHGTAEFSYTVSDNNGGTASATVTVTVAAVNDAPSASPDTVSTDEDTMLVFPAADLVGNDSDVDLDSLTVTAVTPTADTHGTVTLGTPCVLCARPLAAKPGPAGAGAGAADSITYVPTSNYNGPASFNYTISDGNGGTATGQVTITVESVNDAPVVTAAQTALAYTENAAPTAIDENLEISDGDSATLAGATVQITSACTTAEDVLALAAPPPGITVTSYDAVTCTLGLTGAASAATYQTALRAVTYANTSDAPQTTARQVTFTVDDGATASNTASATRAIEVAAVDDPPVAIADNRTVSEDAPVTTIMVLGNDEDVDGGAMTIASVTQPAGGVVVMSASSLTYTPNPNYCNAQAPALTGVSGPDTFSYTLSPGGNTATVSITVSCSDDPPTAVDDSATVAQDSTGNAINVMANDTDIDGGLNTISAVSQPGHGTAAIAQDNLSVLYTPTAGYCNQAPNMPPDTFTYTLASGGTTATVSVTVACTCGQNTPTDFVVGSN